MPGKSKKGGGLESSPVYKKQGYGAPFKMKKSPVKYYEEIEAWRKYKKAKDAAKLGARGALGTIGAAAGLLYDFGKRSIERKKKGLSGFNIEKGKINKPFNF